MDSKTLKRFLAKVNKEPGQGPNGDCWEWMASRTVDGYGTLNIGGMIKRAHRLSYEHFVGPIPDGLCALHTCDNPPCVNPQHLWTGTQTENIQDMTDKGRRASQKGELNGSVKLTEKQVREIRSLHPGERIVDIAQMYGVGKSVISLITRREIWKHI